MCIIQPLVVELLLRHVIVSRVPYSYEAKYIFVITYLHVSINFWSLQSPTTYLVGLAQNSYVKLLCVCLDEEISTVLLWSCLRKVAGLKELWFLDLKSGPVSLKLICDTRKHPHLKSQSRFGIWKCDQINMSAPNIVEEQLLEEVRNQAA